MAHVIPRMPNRCRRAQSALFSRLEPLDL
jgi:hypothetical protein